MSLCHAVVCLYFHGQSDFHMGNMGMVVVLTGLVASTLPGVVVAAHLVLVDQLK